MKETLRSANPYLPLWEHIPDGEPRVFEYGGEKRLYVYGSHDTEKTAYCGRDQVVWSAPLDDLTNWTYHGVCYTATNGSILYAPDVVQKGDTFYLYAAENQGGRIVVASSRSPAGPFTDPVETKLGFDPGILVDDDGRVYAFWGFCSCYCAELEEDMATIKEGTLRSHPIGHVPDPWNENADTAHIDLRDAFFEASSPRKIGGKYVYVYSKRCVTSQPELGVYDDNNGFLSYKWSDSPLEGYQDGGDISFNGGEILKLPDGTGQQTYRWGNNHGGLVEINGQWYIFYHRHTGTDEFARQGMIEPVDIAIGRNGKVYIGDITYVNGEPVSSKPVEMTSSGVSVNGIDAYKIISTGYACHISPLRQAYVKAVYEQKDGVSAPVVNIKDGTTVGFRYLQFGEISPKSVTVSARVKGQMKVRVRVDNYHGKIVAELGFDPEDTAKSAPLTSGIIGKRAVYFEFSGSGEAEFDAFTFDR